MTKSNRLGAALTAVSLIAVASGCATPGNGVHSASVFGGSVNPELGLATKARLALAANDLATAIPLAERAVERSPQDAGYRALLGNCYLAAGRFASAEAAYRDSLSIYSSQPQILLKLALVQIGQGKHDEAKLLLAEAQGVLDASDAGLALALAGDPQGAIALLEPAARAVGSDARTRQNLALAYAIAGDWTQARTVAAQDVPADLLDTRIHQWMTLVQPDHASEQIAAFIGIQPVAQDPGQPVRLALNKEEAIRQAMAEPIPEAAPAQEPAQSVSIDLPPVAPQPEPVALAVAEPVTPPPPYVTEEPVKAALHEPRPALSPAAVRLTDSSPKAHQVAAPRVATGRSRAVVQLGAYSSRERIAVAWARVSSKYGAVKQYTPVTARFSGAHGTVYRLSVKGFESQAEAQSLCSSLKRAGRDCFVRSVSGDAPVQFASR